MTKAPATPSLTERDLEESENGIIKMVAEMHEGMILAITSICGALAAKDAVKLEGLISQLRHTSKWMLENQKPALTQYPSDKLMNYLEMLSRGDGPPNAQH